MMRTAQVFGRGVGERVRSWAEMVAGMRRRLFDGMGYALVLASLLLLLALVTYNPGDPSLDTAIDAPPRNFLGRDGALVADLLLQSIGAAAYLMPLVLLGWAFRLLLQRPLSGLGRRLGPAGRHIRAAGRGRRRRRLGPAPPPGPPRAGAAGSADRRRLCRHARAVGDRPVAARLAHARRRRRTPGAAPRPRRRQRHAARRRARPPFVRRPARTRPGGAAAPALVRGGGDRPRRAPRAAPVRRRRAAAAAPARGGQAGGRQVRAPGAAAGAPAGAGPPRRAGAPARPRL